MPCMDDDSDMPTLSFNFTEIAFIENLEKDRIIGKWAHQLDEYFSFSDWNA